LCCAGRLRHYAIDCVKETLPTNSLIPGELASSNDQACGREHNPRNERSHAGEQQKILNTRVMAASSTTCEAPTLVVQP
jgi:hypothetical protein